MCVTRRPFALIPLIATILLIVLSSPASPQVSEPILTIEAGVHSASLRHMSADSRSRFLATGSADKTVRLWDLSSGKLLNTLRPPIGRGHDGMIEAVAMTPDGATVACGGRTRDTDKSWAVYFFDRESGCLLKRLSGLSQSISQMRFSRDGRCLAVGHWRGGGLRVYAFERRGATVSCSLIRTDEEYNATILGMDFDAEGRLIVSAVDGTLCLYDRDFKIILNRKAPGGKRPRGVSMTADGTRIAVGYHDAARVDILSGKDLTLQLSPVMERSLFKLSNLVSVTWSDDDQLLYAAGSYNPGTGPALIRWSGPSLGSATYLPVPRMQVRSIVPLRGGGIAFGGSNGDLGIFDRNGKERYSSRASLDYFSDRSFLVSSSGTAVQFDFEW